MQVKIIKAEIQPKSFKGKVTNYYMLTSETGKVYKISENSRYTYQNVDGTGLYDIEVGDYMGHEVVKKLKPIATSGMQATSSSATSNEQPAAAADKARLDFAAAKQNEIKLECYAGIAKDCLIANGKKDIKPKDVMQFAKDLMLFHNTIIELGDQLPGYGVDFLQDLKEAFPEATVENKQAQKPVEQPNFEEDPPF